MLKNQQRPRSLLTFVPLLTATLLLSPMGQVHATQPLGPNGFDLSNADVPEGSILRGGPRRDGIASIDEPTFRSARAASDLDAATEVIGIARDGIAKAYPLPTLTRHEVVNDTFGDQFLAITYCPLTGSAKAFEREAKQTFGVSGLLHESNLLIYDRSTKSLFSQLGETALSGPQKGTKLRPVVIERTTWAPWQRRYPNTQVLVPPQTKLQATRPDPYRDYETSGTLWFPVSHRDSRLPAKTRIVGLEQAGVAKAWRLDALEESLLPLADSIGGTELRIVATDGRMETVAGEPLASTVAYWFAWAAFHPSSELWSGNEEAKTGPDGVTSSLAIHDVQTSWDDLGTLFLGGGDATPFADGSIFVISGQLTNNSKDSIRYAVLRYELLNDAGETVYSEEGYNRAAENLLDSDDAATGIQPIAAEDSDSFRMVFFGGEVPPFSSHRISVIEAVREP